MFDVEGDDEELKMNKIRVKIDMVNLLQAGQRSGWTQQQPPPTVDWLIINPGLIMAVSVVTKRCKNTETDCCRANKFGFNKI